MEKFKFIRNQKKDIKNTTKYSSLFSLLQIILAKIFKLFNISNAVRRAFSYIACETLSAQSFWRAFSQVSRAL